MKYEELLSKAVYFDKLLPCFFSKITTEYESYQNKRLKEHPDEYIDWLGDRLPFIQSTYLGFIKEYFRESLDKLSLDDLFVMNLIINGCEHSYYEENGDLVFSGTKDLTFLQAVLNKNTDNPFPVEEIHNDILFDIYCYEDSHVLDPVLFPSRLKREKRNDENDINFAVNSFFFDIPCDDTLIRTCSKLHPENYAIKNVVWDYEFKCKGLYQALIEPDFNPEKKQIWAKDFADLTELVLDGRYLIDGKAVTIVSLPDNEYDFDSAYKEMLNVALSLESCLIHFFNCRKNPEDESGTGCVSASVETEHRKPCRQFLTLTACFMNKTAIEKQENILDGVPPAEYLSFNDNQLSEEDMVTSIYNIIAEKFDYCQKENTFGIKVNCLPRSRERFSSIYEDAAIVKYTPIPTEKEYTIFYIGTVLNKLGYCSEPDKLNAIREKIKSYMTVQPVYYDLYRLALMHEWLFFLLNILKDHSFCPAGTRSKFRKLSNDMQEFIYEDKDSEAIIDEMEEVESKSFNEMELKYHEKIHNEFLFMTKEMLNDSSTLEKLFESKRKFNCWIVSKGINSKTRALFSEVNAKITELIEVQCEEKELYSKTSEYVTQKIGNYIAACMQKLASYCGNDYSREFGKMKKSLITAECLYQIYVSPYVDSSDITKLPVLIQEMDFSCIALEYYTSLELLCNILLYMPYKEKVLDRLPAHSTYEGFLGGSSAERLIDKRASSFRASLELGTLANIYCKYSDNKAEKYTRVKEFLSALSLDIRETKAFAGTILSMTGLRNSSAHGTQILDINKAKTAQDISYIHQPHPDAALCEIGLTRECYNLIAKLLQWFSGLAEDEQTDNL